MSDQIPDQVQFRNPVKSVGYAQVYHMATLDERISDGAYRLFCLYIMYAQQKDLCWPGRTRIAKQLKTSEPTISRRNKELEDAGYIARQRRYGHSSITYIEDVEDIPFLKAQADQILQDRIKNDTIVESEMIQPSYQKRSVEEESCNKNKGEEGRPPAPADDDPIMAEYEAEKREAEEYYSKIPALDILTEEIGDKLPSRSWAYQIHHTVGDDPDDLARWRRVVHAWIGMGWRKNNLVGMLECFSEGRIPGEDRNGNGHNGATGGTNGANASAPPVTVIQGYNQEPEFLMMPGG